jgi:hypothetical protein
MAVTALNRFVRQLFRSAERVSLEQRLRMEPDTNESIRM